MPTTLIAIITNTFTETLRQPVCAVVIGATILLLIFSPSLTMFTLDDDDQLLKDVGISTLLVAGLLLAVFASTTVVTEEIDNKTALTVISKTVSRSTFVIGKFLGVAAAVVMGQYLLSLVLFMVARYGVLEASMDKSDTVVITLGAIAAGLTLIIALVGNYFYHWRFSSTSILLSTIFATVATVMLIFIDPHWHYQIAKNNLPWDLVGPIALALLATLILTALAVAAAIRFNLVMTLIFCSVAFVLGSMVQYWLGPVAASGAGISRYFAWAGLAVLPSINFYVVSNAIYGGVQVPISYIGQTAIYAFLYVSGVLLFALALFRSREIG